jgi:CRISPR-associated protein Csm2
MRNMTQKPQINPKPQRPSLAAEASEKKQNQAPVQTDMTADQKMLQAIKNLKDGLLRNYEIRDLVNQAKEFGEYLKDIDLKTNQIRKFLDALNRLKVLLAQDKEQKFSTIETEVVLLKPKLAYAAARKEDDRRTNPVKPLSDVLSEAINKVKDTEDFYRLVQLIESIIAYHKAAGGKN